MSRIDDLEAQVKALTEALSSLASIQILNAAFTAFLSVNQDVSLADAAEHLRMIAQAIETSKFADEPVAADIARGYRKNAEALYESSVNPASTSHLKLVISNPE